MWVVGLMFGFGSILDGIMYVWLCVCMVVCVVVCVGVLVVARVAVPPGCPKTPLFTYAF